MARKLSNNKNMKKKTYTIPAIKVFNIQNRGILCSSETDLRWSGNKAGTAGPNEIDENSTYDAF
jgi:hypothetical protein